MRSVAVLDDDDASLKSILFLLETLGIYAVGFGHPECFVDPRIAEFDFLIVDHHMPGMTGVEVARLVAAKSQNTSIMLMSGALNDNIIKSAKIQNIKKIHRKPISIRNLTEFLKIEPSS